MKLDAVLDQSSDVRTLDDALAKSYYSLKIMLEISASGLPIFPDVNLERVVLCCQIDQRDIGQLAITLDTGACLIVLGIIKLPDILKLLSEPQFSEIAAHTDQPITFKHGRSELRLHPDGRIRILGDDVSIEALGRMAMKGAIVELN